MKSHLKKGFTKSIFISFFSGESDCCPSTSFGKESFVSLAIISCKTNCHPGNNFDDYDHQVI